MNAISSVAADIAHPAATSAPPSFDRLGTSGDASLAPLPLAGGAGGGHESSSILTPHAQAAFLEHLAQFGNVRLACKACGVSPQTAYRVRRKSPAFAALWDAALLAARQHAEEVLADRALNGWEEAVFYHGEEVATRRRYSDRLLLAHLARLDRLAERAEVSDALAHLDDAVEALGRGEELPVLRQAQDERGGNGSGAPACAGAHDGVENFHQDRVPCVPSHGDHPAEDAAEEAGESLPEPPLELRLRAMEAARPADAPPVSQMGDPGEAEYLQLLGFEAGLDEWWLIASEEELKSG